MTLDPTFWFYLIIIFVSFLGMAIFLFNWARIGNASGVYKYITGLIVGIFIKSSIEFYSYVVRESGNFEHFLDIIHSSYWDFRFLFTLAPLMVLVCQMYYRFFVKRKR